VVLEFIVKFIGEMNKNKWLFLVFGLLFLAIMLWIGYDMSSKTTFPGSKPNLKESSRKPMMAQYIKLLERSFTR
jgi:hypothetical protein